MKVSIRILSMFLAAVLVFSAVPMNVFAKSDINYGIAFVDASSLRLRSAPSTDSKTLSKAYRNEVVVVISKEGDWYKVNYNLQEGYMHSDYLDANTSENAELGYGKINGTNVNLRSGAGTSHKAVAKGTTGDKVYILGISSGWYKVIFKDKICYIRSDYVDLTEIPYENRASSNAPIFYKGGKSTGVAPSASALNGAPATDDTEAPTENNNSGFNSDNASTNSSASVSAGIMHGIGFVTGSGLRLRSEASTGSKTLDSASKGEVVVVISKHGDWYKVIYDLKEGYMHADYLSVKTTENAELGYGIINGTSVNLRSGAGTSNKVVTKGTKGDRAYILGINNGWYKVIFGEKICYIRSDYLDLTEVPYENKSSSNTPKFYRGGKSTGTEPSTGALSGSTGSGSTGSSGNSGSSSGSVSSEPTTATGSKIVSTAKKYLGVPYVWGGASPSGFDCSGFVYYVLRSCGIKASRTLASMYKQGTPVEKSKLQPGDIVFFKNTYKSGISHVGIYVGDGKFIHSPHTGEVVSYANLYSDYYVSHYYGACRFA